MWSDSFTGLADAIREIVGVYIPLDDVPFDFAYITACVLLCIACKYIFSGILVCLKGVFGK